MKIRFDLWTCIILLSTLFITATESRGGDTTLVKVHDEVGWTWYSNNYQWAVFPADSVRHQKIIMHYTLGCPSIGCSDWDYTTMISAMHVTDIIDSSLVLAPNFTANGMSIDTLAYSIGQTWIYYYDTLNMQTDSVSSGLLFLYFFEDPNNPLIATDSLKAWSANYYNFLFDSTGMVIDSVFVTGDSILYTVNDTVYLPFNRIVPIELARVITPYGGNYGASWKNTWSFDVTDYASILHDSIRINAFYGGWSNGFTITLDFEFIEGIPPHDANFVENLWNSGPGGFQYGNTANPINSHLGPTKVAIPLNSAGTMLRFVPTGHSFGGNENCAEFCIKQYEVFLDGIPYFVDDIWRDDCGSNALYPQAGTWLYDRSNWCPGERAFRRDHDLTPYVVPGDSLDIEMQISNYVYAGGAGFHPNYIIESQLFHYSVPNFTLDAAVESIVSPNNDFTYNRVNPICSHPEIVIQNTGVTALTSLTIEYEIAGGTVHTYNWTGFLNFLDKEKVTLGSLDLTSSTSDKFIVRILDPNGGTDQYAGNNSMSTRFNRPPDFSGGPVIVHLRTNNIANDTQWILYDEAGTIVHQRTAPMTSNTLYRDTLNLPNGCYRFFVIDQQKNGLSFFNFNNDGSGYVAFFNSAGLVTKSFPTNFGTFIDYRFTTGMSTGINENLTEDFFDVYPNPSTGEFFIGLSDASVHTAIIDVVNSSGQLIMRNTYPGLNSASIKLDLSEYPSGLYFVSVIKGDKHYSRRIVKQ